MFLNKILERNPRLVDAAILLHKQELIQPDTYVIDVTTLLENAKMILAEARKYELTCLYMSKQIGRNIDICHKLEEMGYDGAVTVDYREALYLAKNNLKLWNVGHLVQTPKSVLKQLIPYGVKYFTVYSIEKMQEINEIAQEIGIIQSVTIKMGDQNCLIYDGQQSGFSYSELDAVVTAANTLTNIRIAGVTAFPCMLYNDESKKIETTPNFELLLRAKARLEVLGCTITEVNTPSSNTANSMKLAYDNHATTVEPGHALTGTTPYHVDHFDLERPALVYVSEVSHPFQERSYVYGGGHYRRSHMSNALIVNNQNERSYAKIEAPSDDNIDYTLRLDGVYPVGSTVICCFRTQIFTTRSQVALIDTELSEPKLLGLYDAHGFQL